MGCDAMNVGQAISALQRLDPKMEVVAMASKDGYQEVFLGVVRVTLVRRRSWRRAPSGFGAWESIECRPRTRAKRIEAVVIA